MQVASHTGSLHADTLATWPGWNGPDSVAGTFAMVRPGLSVRREESGVADPVLF